MFPHQQLHDPVVLAWGNLNIYVSRATANWWRPGDRLRRMQY
jgi:hypothetical protein